MCGMILKVDYEDFIPTFHRVKRMVCYQSRRLYEFIPITEL